MFLLQERSQTSTSRITLKTAEIAADTTVVRALDRDRFDIELELQNSTTYLA